MVVNNFSSYIFFLQCSFELLNFSELHIEVCFLENDINLSSSPIFLFFILFFYYYFFFTYQHCMVENKGYHILCSISMILLGENFLLKDSCDIVHFKYAPIVSAEAESSFFMYKALLAENRKSFVFENFHKVFIMHCNSGS